VLNIHYVANMKIWREVNRKGVISLAERLKKDGLAQAISVSTHDAQVVKLVAQTSIVDSVMYQVNAANNANTINGEALKFCHHCGVSVVAMKPFAGGELLKSGKSVTIAEYKTGWKSLSLIVPKCATPVRLLSYVLDQPAVCTAVTGITSTRELAANLAYLTSSKEEKDYRSLLRELQK